VENATDPDDFIRKRAVIAAVNKALGHAENNMLTIY